MCVYVCIECVWSVLKSPQPDTKNGLRKTIHLIKCLEVSWVKNFSAPPYMSAHIIPCYLLNNLENNEVEICTA